jgi:hypothetical protein
MSSFNNNIIISSCVIQLERVFHHFTSSSSSLSPSILFVGLVQMFFVISFFSSHVVAPGLGIISFSEAIALTYE